MGSVLSDKDVNAPVQTQDAAATKDAAKDVVKDDKATGAQILEYHRQVLQSKMAEEKYGIYGIYDQSKASSIASLARIPTVPFTTSTNAAPRASENPQSRLLANAEAANDRQQQYISPSDDIMSPCTAKLNAFKGRLAGRVKPKSLFARASAKKFDGDDIFGAKSTKDTSSKDDDSKPSN
ncbi:hypothetical protein F5Y13DRAFT_175870 [Hypoxylon sp. FL1857]|nr:hypothetical protein F5Y13DRAFT_175870 [Hypoxylon sp. FL1857]